MSLFIEIAGVKLCLEGEDFLGRLSLFERILLTSFISQKIFSGKPSLVYVKHILYDNALSYKYKIDSKTTDSIDLNKKIDEEIQPKHKMGRYQYAGWEKYSNH